MPMVIDIETIPRKEIIERWREIVQDETSLIGRYLPKIDGRLKDPDKIKAAMDELEKEVIKKCSIDPDLGRVIAIGAIQIDVNPKTKKATTKEFVFCDEDEAGMLSKFWNVSRKYNPGVHTIGFNNIGFDLPFLYRRSLRNKISVPGQMVLKRYSCMPHFDCMMTLADWDFKKCKSLDFYAEFFELSNRKCAHGSDVYDLYKAGKFKEISEYVIQDCRVNLELYEILKDYYPIGYPTKFDTKGGY